MHEPLGPFVASSGPRPAKVVLLGEAFGRNEAELRRPFVGESGKELFLMLGEANPGLAPEIHNEMRSLYRYGLAWVRKRDEWLAATGIHLTNVLALQPQNNDLDTLCGTRADVGKEYTLPALSRGHYLKWEYLAELGRLEAELIALQPNLVVALGNTALWALAQQCNIGSVRGTVMEGHLGAWHGKILPTYHPAAIMRQWQNRPIVVADLLKASREAEFPEIRRPARRVVVEPDLQWLESKVFELLHVRRPQRLAVDVETAAGMITDIGFATSPQDAFVVTFGHLSHPSGSYWPDRASEERAWSFVQQLLLLPCEKVFQNGLYDLQYMLRMGLRVANVAEDTMLKHHSVFPEMKKGLGFLGSIYCSEPAWKLMRTAKTDTVKRDE